MDIIQMALGALETNCYILYQSGEPECLVVDPGFESRQIAEQLEELDIRPKYIIATHGHGDHIGAIPGLKSAYPDAEILIHRLDGDLMADGKRNHSFLMGSLAEPKADQLLEEGQEIQCGSMRLKVLHTPGHTPGGISLTAPGCVFAGDTLFNGSVGRTDLGGGDFDVLARSIREKLYALPDETVVYTGHGPATTVGKEKKTNPFVRANGVSRDEIHG
ncbi:MAG: MBL fold metallo-hydrolase [Peptococcaceae bacterium]|jgi:glyoxylase-like metal-dependent hydrolase (beta-lactamase superfamily II)|nr:MBL fold metallo-hydrolase [Peptococcaceae bacterium]